MADFDLVIIGGGPAGLTAGLYAARANMSTILFEAKDIGGELLKQAMRDLVGRERLLEPIRAREAFRAGPGDVDAIAILLDWPQAHAVGSQGAFVRLNLRHAALTLISR